MGNGGVCDMSGCGRDSADSRVDVIKKAGPVMPRALELCEPCCEAFDLGTGTFDGPDEDTKTSQMTACDASGLQEIVCEECDGSPRVYWDSEVETIALACACGERMVPRDAVLEHDLMPAGVNWTVEDDDATL